MHTLGLAHNFAASTYGRASVMDYPAPLVEIKDGRLDLSNAYAAGIGAYDKFAVTYAYAQFPAGAYEAAELEKVLTEGVRAGMLFISDEDARPAGAAHPLANLWDNGADPVATLRHEMGWGRSRSAVRDGDRAGGHAVSLIERILPLYMHHAIKCGGGQAGAAYHLPVKTAAAGPARPGKQVPAARRATQLAAVLETVKVEVGGAAAHPQLIPPRALDTRAARRAFPKRTTGLRPRGRGVISADLAVRACLSRDAPRASTVSTRSTSRTRLP